MTTLSESLKLILLCLRCFLAPFFGANQPAALVLRVQAAIDDIAMLIPTDTTPARPIHAPTLVSPA
jgi:hypothetical protein